MTTRSPLAALAAAALLAACGGGGGSEPATPPGSTPGAGSGAGGTVAHVFSLVGTGPVAGQALERDVVVMLATGVSVADVAAAMG